MTWNSIVLFASAARTRWHAANNAERVLFSMLVGMSLVAAGSWMAAWSRGEQPLEVIMWLLWSVVMIIGATLVVLTSMDRATQKQLTRTYLQQAGGNHTLRMDGRVVARYDAQRGWQASA